MFRTKDSYHQRFRQTCYALTHREFGSTFQNQLRIHDLPKFDSEAFFQDLKIHDARLERQRRLKSPIKWQEILKKDVVHGKANPHNDFNSSNISETTVNIENSTLKDERNNIDLGYPRFPSTNSSIHMVDEFSSNENSWVSTFVDNIEVTELIQRINDLLLRTRDFHSVLWKGVINDLHR